MARASNGDLAYAWANITQDGTASPLTVQRRVGGTWLSPEQVVGSNHHRGNPSVISLGSDRWMLMWSESNLAASSLGGLTGDQIVAEQEIWYAIREPGGWGSPTRLSTNAVADDSPRLVPMSGSSAMAVWRRASSTSVSDIAASDLVYSIWNGSTWSAVSTLANTSQRLSHVALAALPSGNVVATWLSDAAGDDSSVTVWTSLFNGVAWAAPQIISAAAGARRDWTRVVALANGVALASWTEEGENGTVLMTAQRNASTGAWSTPEAATTAQWVIAKPEPVSDGNIVRVVYHGLADESELVGISRDFGDANSAWSEPEILTPSAGEAWWPSAASLLDGDLQLKYVKDLSLLDGTADALPDLRVSEADIAVLTVPPVTGTANTVRVTVRNSGFAASNATNISLYLGDPATGGTLLTTQTLPALAIGQSAVIDLPWTPSASSSFALYVVADRSAFVAELNESNNTANTVVGVLARPTINLDPTSDTGTPGDLWTADSTPTVTGTATGAASVAIFVDSQTVSVAQGAVTSGSYLVTLPSLTNGSHDIWAQAYDAVGQPSPFSQTLTILVDAVTLDTLPAPALEPASDTGAPGDNRTRARRPGIIGNTAKPQAPVLVYDGAILLGQTTTDDLGVFVFTPNINLSSGVHLITVVLADAAGNQSLSSPALSITVDPTIYVDQDSGGAIHDGTGWDGAYLDLQSAVDAAGSGDVIRVASGVYTTSVNLESGVALYGGYSGYAAADPDVRDLVAHPTVLTNGDTIITATGVDSSAVLDGFTLTGASSRAMININSSPTVTSCTFLGNSVTNGYSRYGGGAGMYNLNSSPTFPECIFRDNVAAGIEDGLDGFGGGGMYNSNSAPTLVNCTFSRNSASGIDAGGGGMCNYDDSAPTLINCSFSGNSAVDTRYGGGGMCNVSSFPTLLACAFSENFTIGAISGGGAVCNINSEPALRNCTLAANSAADAGGGGISNFDSEPSLSECTIAENSADIGAGMFNDSLSSPSLVNCTISSNSAHLGGGMYNTGESYPNLANCKFNGNLSYEGGGIYNSGSYPTIANCTFSGNTADGNGGGMYSGDDSYPELTNCTFASNSAGDSGGGSYAHNSYPMMVNSILWGNTAVTGAQIVDASGSATAVEYCDVQDGWAGTGNLTVDPLFTRSPSSGADTVWGTADDDYGDLKLQSGSACINAGNNAAVSPEAVTDLASNPRICGPAVDMGAYEHVEVTPTSAAYLFDAPLPTVRLTFGPELAESSLAAGDLVLLNQNTGETLNCDSLATVSYDTAARLATWVFASQLPDGAYQATLPIGSISDVSGHPLAVNYGFEFFAFAGDATRDRRVDTQDFNVLAGNFGTSGNVFSMGSFDYDTSGLVDSTDFNILVSQYSKTLPPVRSAAAMHTGAPATSLFGNISMDDPKDVLVTVLT